MGVNLRNIDGTVSQHLLNIADVYIGFQQTCGKGVSEHMGGDMLVNGRKADPLCRICEGGSQNWHPEDLLEGHEEEILARMRAKELISD